ncbi:superoxide dismutase family protein [Parvularcula lutaonensis]|uniref:Superoxide dismutase family protein n=1 Tax=Parvularcula lutaonensis TaxID=491923 RepID=A0ABV7M920_9PROT|nr:superoxide dismutase family protein [Parvularcula lutaonensis]GGY42364.1 hypothetical protein GCM10007148_08770 [Parvularcula lutaonensis]
MTPKKIALFAVPLALAACSEDASIASSAGAVPVPVAEDADPTGEMTVAITGTEGTAIGEATVRPGPHGMVIRLMAEGLPEGWHGVHLHQVGDCSDFDGGFKKSGSHINISGTEHGVLNPEGYHTGADFPNLWADADGLHGELFAGGLLLDQARDDDGFAMIIHANEDDHVTQPIGGAGPRLACAAFR